MKKLQASTEFKVGEHNIGWLYGFEQFKDTAFEKRAMPTSQKINKAMTDAEIESELKPGLCELGDILVFLDEAGEEYKDGYCNLFYSESCVVNADWHAGNAEWRVLVWRRGGGRWRPGGRVLSPATDSRKLSTKSLSHSDPLTLGLPDELEINGVVYKRKI